MSDSMPSIQFKCPHCSQSIEQPIEAIGQLMECPSCNETIEVQKQRATKLPPPPKPHHLPPRGVPKLKVPMSSKKQGQLSKGRVYKVLTTRNKWFAGNSAPEKLEEAINFYATKGWTVVSVLNTGMPMGPGSLQQEIMVVMGKNK